VLQFENSSEANEQGLSAPPASQKPQDLTQQCDNETINEAESGHDSDYLSEEVRYSREEVLLYLSSVR
jgi:hypothetical protein